MVKLFLKIYEAFEGNKELFEALDLPPILHIDKYRGQPLNPAQFEYYPLPALFIESGVVWEKKGKAYDGKMSLGFHLVTDATWDTSNISTNPEAGLKTLILHAVTRYILDDLESENTGKLRRVDSNPVDTGVIIYELMRYECEYYDPMVSGRELVDVMIEALKINGNLKKTVNPQETD